MRRLLALCLLCLIVALPLHAQDDESALYYAAIQRIEKAREDEATILELDFLGLTELPPEIGQLENLYGLSLAGNQLTNLPLEIGQLSNLNWLNLDRNQFTELPTVVGQLQNLQYLHVEENYLQTLPPEIGNLSKLEELYLDENQLTSLPPEIGELNNLRILYADNNKLEQLPREIGQLNNLQYIFLYSNELTTLPSEIAGLDRLCQLDLRYNHLRSLPTTLSNFDFSTQFLGCNHFAFTIWVEGNPLVSPPPEVVEQGTAAILDYLRNQAWYHTQRLILGAAGGVGLVVLLLLGFRWKQRGGRKSKPKRGN